MNEKLLALMAFCLLFALAAAVAVAAGGELYCGRMPSLAYPIEVVRVVDGDTIDVCLGVPGFGLHIERRVRLIGVDTPEMRGPEAVSGKRVTMLVRGWLSRAKNLRLRDAGKGKFNRLGVIESDQGSLNNWLLEHGHADPYCGGTKP